jgi:hypothetical protein
LVWRLARVAERDGDDFKIYATANRAKS